MSVPAVPKNIQDTDAHAATALRAGVGFWALLLPRWSHNTPPVQPVDTGSGAIRTKIRGLNLLNPSLVALADGPSNTLVRSLKGCTYSQPPRSR
jgi:hypothetical protein